MLKIREAVIVEGRYDKIKLSSIVDAPIIETNGFRVFSRVRACRRLLAPVDRGADRSEQGTQVVLFDGFLAVPIGLV